MGWFIVLILAYKLLIIKLLTVFSSLHYTKKRNGNANRKHKSYKDGDSGKVEKYL